MSTPRRLVVIGPESTGKTTLAQQLGAWLQAPVVPEFAREHAARVARPLTADDVEPIARGQVAAEDLAHARAIPRPGPAATPRPGPASVSEPRSGTQRRVTPTPAHDLVVLDTDLVSTTVYAEHYYGHTPPWILEAARERLGALYLLTAPDLPWEADGIRDQPRARRQLHQAFGRRLQELGACVLPVSGAGPVRLEVAMAAVRGWRAAQRPTSGAVPSSGAGSRVTR